MKKAEFIVPEDRAGIRLDAFLAGQLAGECSRTFVQKVIREGQVLVNAEKGVSGNHKVHAFDRVSIQYQLPERQKLLGEAIPLDIVFEDDALWVINKPAGMVVHPGAGRRAHTLANALVHQAASVANVGELERPGIVHRLDRDTSGLLVAAKTRVAHEALSRQFRDHSITRTYQVVVKGVVQHDQGRCDVPIGRGKVFRRQQVVEFGGTGKEALTHFRVLERFQRATLLEVSLETGRTHQIRVHMRYLGFPVLGDLLYGVSWPYIDRQALHAKTLGFSHPVDGRWLSFDSKLPEDMIYLISQLRLESEAN